MPKEYFWKEEYSHLKLFFSYKYIDFLKQYLFKIESKLEHLSPHALVSLFFLFFYGIQGYCLLSL